jgi:hypothetical protein
MSDCPASPVFVEISGPALESGSDLQVKLFSVVNNKAPSVKEVVERNLWVVNCGVSFYIENIGGRDFVVARGIVKRGGVDDIVNVVKDVFTLVGVDLSGLRVRVFDPCEFKCQGE